MFATIYRPYAIAGQTISEAATSTCKTLSSFAITIYKTLTSKQAKHVYRDVWTITSIVVQVTVLLLYAAGLCAIIAVQQFLAYYEAEWAEDIKCVLNYPASRIGQVSELAVEPITIHDDEAQLMIPAAVQTIIDSNCKTTKKLRDIATHFDIHWRNAHGAGKHLRKDEIREALCDWPEILAALS